MKFKPYQLPSAPNKFAKQARDLCWRLNTYLPEVEDKHTVTPLVVSAVAWLLGIDFLFDRAGQQRVLDAFGVEWVESMGHLLLQPKPEFFIPAQAQVEPLPVPHTSWFDLRMAAAELARQHGYAAIVRAYIRGVPSLHIAIGADLDEVQIRAYQLSPDNELVAEFDADGAQS